jgi:predicted SAM-dependent methyltransferase
MKLLNLGCGQHYHPDWHNLDFVSTGPGVVAHNLLEGIPFEDAAFDIVYHSHVLEHFSKKDGQKFINECYRVLKPGGIIRIAVPDLEQLTKEYLGNLEKALQENSPLNAANYDWSVIELLDQMVRDRSGGEMAAYWSQDQIINEDQVANRMGWEFTRFRNALSTEQPEAEMKTSKKPSYYQRMRSKIFRMVFKK